MLALSIGALALAFVSPAAAAQCRNQPGDAGFPTQAQWDQLKAELGGRLVQPVPTAKYCKQNNCTTAEWQSTDLRALLPGAMNSNNWEQDYATPSMCLLNGTTCDQGSVPLYAVNATTAAHIQAGVRFAAQHNLRLSIKASGHDFLGRSTAKNSLLIWTQHLKNTSFTEHFRIGNKDYGAAMTTGSGAGLKQLYTEAETHGKIFVGGTAATVCAAGGYSQGAGHSAFSPVLGLAADNAIEYQIVIANGSLITANEFSHPDLFWAIRGGGGGSWGVIVSATFHAFPIFNATLHQTTIVTNSTIQTGNVMAAHASHIFDLDPVRAGQYYYLSGSPGGSFMSVSTFAANVTGDELRATVSPEVTVSGTPNDLIPNGDWAIEQIVANLTTANPPNTTVAWGDDVSGQNLIMGSRLIPSSAFKNNASAIGAAYTTLLNQGVPGILGHLVAGGQVAANAHVSNAVNPKWRTAKSHVIVSQGWIDSSTSPQQVEQLRHNLTYVSMPVLDAVTGETDAGSYSSEGDVLEPKFQTTFFGPNYARLKSVKAVYDPHDLFIVGAGVGSENWDEYGLCRK
ncbi:hypothetical protein EVG20_g9013 [Dentipellis fragilis]|uniref:FAD-binding PCMH-type domain-containing protein n=1 Tax=Dentipellis fragilis TaxID=205917 RepID=A0A4Y9Y367_9AGAM|nr:hypothetical protein EVG20_g9013 [Dentipellis fragilis]